MADALLTSTPPALFKLLGHDLRWHLLSSLVLGDLRVHELVERLDRPQNLVSYHLRQLRDAGLVRERRSSRDGRDVYYSLDLPRLQTLYTATGERLHPALGAGETGAKALAGGPEAWRTRVLFLCTHNSARSQMAEGILRGLGDDRVEVFSAGSEPGSVHPLAVRALLSMNIDISHQASKHMAQFAGQSFDYIITVCDRVREACPVFPGDPQRIHWSFADPAAVEGPEARRYQAFLTTARELRTRIGYLLLMIHRYQA